MGFLSLALVGFVILCSLGVWQLQRHEEKLAQGARIASRLSEAPVALPSPSQWQETDENAWLYRRVHASGVLYPSREVYWFHQRDDLGPGYDILTPMRLHDGGWVVVNRGFFPTRATLSPARNAEQEPADITGIAHLPTARRWFDPREDAAQRIWVVRDLTAMAAWMEIAPTAPWFLHADAPARVGSLGPQPAAAALAPKPREVDHIAYAMTWFAMAICLAVVTFVYCRKAKGGALS